MFRLDALRSIRYENYSLIILLFTLLIILLVYPFMGGLTDSTFWLKIFLSIMLISAVTTTTHQWSSLIISTILAVIAMLSGWRELFESNLMWMTINLSAEIVFFAYVIWIHIVKIMTIRTVTKNLLFGSLCVYLLIGLMMTFIYILIDLYIPNSFNQAMSIISHGHVSLGEHFFRYVYYSFVTMTTLGYGDVHPLSQPAQAFAYLEAVSGQFYLTVLVARLVGLQISKTKKI